MKIHWPVFVIKSFFFRLELKSSILMQMESKTELDQFENQTPVNNVF